MSERIELSFVVADKDVEYWKVAFQCLEDEQYGSKFQEVMEFTGKVACGYFEGMLEEFGTEILYLEYWGNQENRFSAEFEIHDVEIANVESWLSKCKLTGLKIQEMMDD